MSFSLLLIALLIAASAFFSMAELSLAASRRLNLQQRADGGDARAARVLAVQAHPGDYFTVVQIGVNTVAILAGIVGEGAFTPHFEAALRVVVAPELAATLGFAASFASITALFIVMADLVPKRLAMSEPERVAMALVGPMLLLCRLLKPLAWAFSGITEGLIRLLGLPAKRDETISHRDILALTEAGYQAGVVADEEQQVIANVFELDTRTVETVMTNRERIVFFSRDDDDALIRTRIADTPHSTYLVCDGGDIDRVAGYVDATDLFQRVLRDEPLSLREDGGVIVNEYSLVVGVVTLNDVMSTVMGALVAPHDEEQIVRREDGSFLADGITPIPDVARALDIADWPNAGTYDTLAGFLMVMLRRIPRRTDVVEWQGWRFEVVDVDSYRVDQVMITAALGGVAALTG